MSQASIGLRSFNGGVIDRESEGRTDLKQYAASAREITNFIPKVNGSLTRRPGTRYVTNALSATQTSRLIPFPVGEGENYMLEFNHRKVRVFKGDSALQTSGVQLNAGDFYPGCVFRAPQAHGFYHGQRVQITGTAPGQSDLTLDDVTTISSNTITFAAHGLESGDAVRIEEFTGMTNVPAELVPFKVFVASGQRFVDPRILYVIKVDDNNFKLAKSYALSGATSESTAEIAITDGSYDFRIRRVAPFATSTDYYVCLPKAVVLDSEGLAGATDQQWPLGYDGTTAGSVGDIFDYGLTDSMGPYKLSGDSWTAYQAITSSFLASNPAHGTFDNAGPDVDVIINANDEKTNPTTGVVYLATARVDAEVHSHIEIATRLNGTGAWPGGNLFNLQLNLTLTPTPAALATTFHLSTDPENLHGSIVRHGFSPASDSFSVGPTGGGLEEVVLTTPYSSTPANDEVAELDYSQKADRIFFYHKNYPPMELNRWADGKLRFQQTPMDATPVGPQGRIKGVQAQLGEYVGLDEAITPYITNPKSIDRWGQLYRVSATSNFFGLNQVGQTFARFGNHEAFIGKQKYGYTKITGQPLQMSIGTTTRLGERFFRQDNHNKAGGAGTFDGGTWADTSYQQYRTPGNTMVQLPTYSKAFEIVTATDQISLGVDWDNSQNDFLDGEPISFRAGPAGLPPELEENKVYYVRDRTSISIKIAETSGGTALSLTSGTYEGSFIYSCAFKMMFEPASVNTTDFSTLGFADPLEYATLWFDGGIPPEGIYGGTKYRVRLIQTAGLKDRFYLEHASDSSPVAVRSSGSGLCYMSVDFGSTSSVIGMRCDYDPGGSGYMNYWGTNKWFDAVWGAEYGYPEHGTQYEQRHVLAGSPAYPTQVWLSRTGFDNDFFIMEASAEPAVRTAKGRGYIITDASGFSFEPSSNQTSKTQWIVGHNSLLLGTATDIFEISSSSERLAITPTNVNARSISTGGAAPVRPVRAGQDIIYVSNSRSAILGLLFDGASVVSKPQSLTQYAQNVVDSAPEELAWQEEPEPILWVRRADGRLYGCTYNREQSVVAWHKHEIGGSYGSDSFGHVKSIAVVPHTAANRSDDYDRLWMTVQRTINGNSTQYIEYMTPMLRDWESEKQGHYVDSAPAPYVGAVDNKYHYSWAADFSLFWNPSDPNHNGWNPGSGNGTFPNLSTADLEVERTENGFSIGKKDHFKTTALSGGVGVPSALTGDENTIPLAICSGTDPGNPIPSGSISPVNKYFSAVLSFQTTTTDGRPAELPSVLQIGISNEGDTVFLGGPTQVYPPQFRDGVQYGDGTEGGLLDPTNRNPKTGLLDPAFGGTGADLFSQTVQLLGPTTFTWDLSMDPDLTGPIDPDGIRLYFDESANPADFHVTIHGLILGKDVPGPNITPVQIANPNQDSESTTVPFDASNGLVHLIGETVSVFADAKELPTVVPDALGNATISQRSNYVTAGLGYDSTYTSVPLEATVEGQTTIQGFKKRVVDAFLRLYRSFGGNIGQDASNLTPIGNEADGDNSAKTGIVPIRGLQHEWDEEARVHISVTGPAPFTVNSITARTDWSER